MRVAALVGVALGATLLLGQTSPNRAPGPPLPPGPMQAKVMQACLICHNASIIVQQQLDRRVWTKELDKMIRWGAPVAAADRESLIDYLVEHFGPREEPSDEPLPEGRGVAQVRAACLGCHGADLIVERHLDRRGWTSVLERMEAWGAPVRAADRGVIVEYLARHFPLPQALGMKKP